MKGLIISIQIKYNLNVPASKHRIIRVQDQHWKWVQRLGLAGPLRISHLLEINLPARNIHTDSIVSVEHSQADANRVPSASSIENIQVLGDVFYQPGRCAMCDKDQKSQPHIFVNVKKYLSIVIKEW